MPANAEFLMPVLALIAWGIAASTAQPFSLVCEQSVNRQLNARGSMSANVSWIPPSAIQR